MDTFSPAKRAWIMAQVRSTGTRLELLVRHDLDELGLHYSLQGKHLPGTPDIVFDELKLAIFVNGCFWHWHGCKRSRMPATRREYWEAKITGNVRRDRRNKRLLWATGWHCCSIWECEVEQGVKRASRKISALTGSQR